MIRERQPRSRRPLIILLLVVAALLAVTALRVGGPPEIAIEPQLAAIGKSTPVRVTVRAPGRGLEDVKVELTTPQGTTALAEEHFTPAAAWKLWGSGTAERVLELTVGSDTVPGLRDGNATLKVTASRAGTWLRHPDPAVAQVELPVRLTPPLLALQSSDNVVAQGGSGAVRYRVGPSAKRHGVQAGGWFFPGYPAGGGGDCFALFGIPYDLDDPSQVLLVAEDEVGNRTQRRFLDLLQPRPLQKGKIELNDEFLAKVVPEILSHTPDLPGSGDLLADYLHINRDLRRRNGEQLVALAASSSPRWEWSGAFEQLPRSGVMSPFAARRTYFYQGREVDTQDHLGFDLASTSQAPVPAANGGKVLLADYFGIYGNTVILDHGYGLLSLYAHLSGFAVQAGQQVQRGQTVGHTGATGLAGGDHLHFTMLIHGLPVNPVEWWDSRWIASRIDGKLGDAGPRLAAGGR